MRDTESKIWDIIDSIKRNFSRADSEQHNIFITGRSDYYIASFSIESGKIMSFKIEKYYRFIDIKMTLESTLESYTTYYKIRYLRTTTESNIDSVLESPTHSEIGLVYRDLVQCVRVLKLNEIGI